MLEPVQSIKTCLAKSFQFYGRATLTEFWWFALLWLPIACVIWFVVSPSDSSRLAHYGSWFLQIVICVPLLSAGARRSIDAGISSTWIGYGFSGILFAEGLRAIKRTAPPETITTWMTPVASTLFVASSIALAFILTRPSKPGPPPSEVTP